MIEMTGKQRAYLKSLAMNMQPIFQLGKGSLTPENTEAIREALAARELIKINVLQNCMDDPNELAQMLAERTHSTVVQVIGKKIVLYKEGKEEKRKIILPGTKAPIKAAAKKVVKKNDKFGKNGRPGLKTGRDFADKKSFRVRNERNEK